MRFLFKSVNLDTIVPYMERWARTRQKSSDYSSGVLLCWERALGYQFAFDDDEELVWIKGASPDEHFLAPVGNWNIKGWDEIIAARFGRTAEFRLVPEKLVDIWRKQMGDAVEATENRASWEYLHRVSDLATLAGKKYVKKRNRVNQFSKQNPYEYLPITTELLPRIVLFQRAWCESYRIFNDSGSIERESEGIVRNILGNWDALPQMIGGAIEVMGRIVAYTVAEIVGETLMIHFEKASLEYNAAYQVINHEFLVHEGEPYKCVNREEDMDDPGLRDAKMSYHPSSFIKKYTVRIKL
ncbi:phosphatidylglycerol lysyltransferase domain-containing protein [Synergistaceae bacterium OttesenSCG-928-I11]|nr:phosphatidylglycerol lysyltransferase domain-containing protein [Synergistaceae bacterium OttesenSCG-928-I11]